MSSTQKPDLSTVVMLAEQSPRTVPINDRIARLNGYGPAMYEPVVAIDPRTIYAHPSARIDSFCKLEGRGGIFIGEHVHIASFCHIGIGGGTVILEDGSSCGSGACIVSGSNVPGPDHGCSAVAPDAVFSRSFVHIKKNATLFVGATVLPGVTVIANRPGA